MKIPPSTEKNFIFLDWTNGACSYIIGRLSASLGADIPFILFREVFIPHEAYIFRGRLPHSP